MPSLRLTDDLGRVLVIGRPPERIVSLVPSDTYTLVALGAADWIVGRTTYCETPEAQHAATVGGTKNVDVDAVLALEPHLVIANQEENTRTALEALALRVPVFVSLPRRVEDGIAHVARLARILGVADHDNVRTLIRRGYRHTKIRAATAASPDGREPDGREPDGREPDGREPDVPAGRATDVPAGREFDVPAGDATDVPAGRATDMRGHGTDMRGHATAVPVRRRAFIPIWKDPLMTMNADTFGSDVLAHVGIENVFGDRLRLYPLAADLGKSAPHDATGRDVRYPRVTLDEVRERKPDVVILPDEPYAFAEDDLSELGIPIVHVSGKDLFWYGAWTIDALDRLAAQL